MGGALPYAMTFLLSLLSQTGTEERWKRYSYAGQLTYCAESYGQAEQLFLAAVKEAESGGWRDSRLALSLNNLAQVYHRQNRYLEAEQTFLNALRSVAQTTREQSVTAAILNNLAVLYRQQMRFDDAEKLLKQAITATKEKSETQPVYLTALALNYFDQAKHREAAALYKRALDMVQKIFGPRDSQTATAEENLALVYYRQGRFLPAMKLFRDALAVLEKQDERNETEIAGANANLAAVLLASGAMAEAEILLPRLLQSNPPAGHQAALIFVTGINNLAEELSNAGRNQDAAAVLRRAVPGVESALGATHPEVGQLLNHLGLIYHRDNRLIEAEAAFSSALQVTETTLGPAHPALIAQLDNYARLMSDMGRPQDAEKFKARSQAIRAKVRFTVSAEAWKKK